jgi:hypothetical protein
LQSALFPAALLAVVAAFYVRRTLARRRAVRNVSGGRKALVLNLDRSRW